MSGVALGWAWKQEVPDAVKKLLLVKLADQANDEGQAWPARRSLAEAAGVSERTVQRHIGELVELGLLEVAERKRGNGSQTSNLYVLAVGKVSLLADDIAMSPLPKRGTTELCPGGGDTAMSPPETSSLESSLESLPPPATAKETADIVWDVLAEVFPAPVTASERSDFGKTKREILEATTQDRVRIAMETDLLAFPQAYREFLRGEVARRVEAMGSFSSHRSLRLRWAELGERTKPPNDDTAEAPPPEPQTDAAPCACVAEGVADRDCPDCGGTGIDGWVS